MSKDNIKKGRYSNETHRVNKDKVKQNNKRELDIPHLLRHSKADDIITVCLAAFSNTPSVYWANEIEGFHKKFLNASQTMDDGIFNKDTYMDILKTTGVEVDTRRVFTEFFEKVMNVNFKHFLSSLRKIPGTEKLINSKFILNLLKNSSNVGFIWTAILNISKNNHSFIFKLDDNHTLYIKKNELVNLSTPKVVDSIEAPLDAVIEANLTFEENLFLTTLNVFTPNAITPGVKEIYEMLIIAFYRYLENQYGSKYYLRLRELMNLFSIVKLQSLYSNKWIKEEREYLTTVYKSNYIKIIVDKHSPNDVEALLQELNLTD
ncbi:unnamed protein product [Dimorphilus gyrociliatus]|uniref:Uncharacterized protein n=1 Tax=Dimorphilus gyrociliatus TaxID=2664684 RepID=A0A7I8VWK8_9ANNE|nr:unnamed protein product [Dimorphilus gyrociliatus]